METVEQRAGKRRQRNEAEIRERDAQHLRGHVHSHRIVVEARREYDDEQRRSNDADQAHQRHHDDEVAAHHRDELAHLLHRLAIAIAGEHRHECLRERAFGKQAAGKSSESGTRRRMHPRSALRRRSTTTPCRAPIPRCATESSCSRRRCRGGRDSACRAPADLRPSPPKRRPSRALHRHRRLLTRVCPDGILSRFIFSRTLRGDQLGQ